MVKTLFDSGWAVEPDNVRVGEADPAGQAADTVQGEGRQGPHILTGNFM